MKLRPNHTEGLPQIIDRILDKGVVIDAKIRLAISETQLIKIRATTILSSFSGAVKHGLDIPSEVILESQPWRNLILKEGCPQCKKRLDKEELKFGCPWCGFKLN